MEDQHLRITNISNSEQTVEGCSFSDSCKVQNGSLLRQIECQTASDSTDNAVRVMNVARQGTLPCKQDCNIVERPAVTNVRRNLTLSMISSMEQDEPISEHSHCDLTSCVSSMYMNSQPTNLTQHDAHLTASNLQSTNQDTGYATGSLQTTNLESVLQSGYISGTFNRQMSETSIAHLKKPSKVDHNEIFPEKENLNVGNKKQMFDQLNMSVAETDPCQNLFVSSATRKPFDCLFSQPAGNEKMVASSFSWEPLVSSTPQKLLRSFSLADMDTSYWLYWNLGNNTL